MEPECAKILDVGGPQGHDIGDIWCACLTASDPQAAFQDILRALPPKVLPVEKRKVKTAPVAYADDDFVQLVVYTLLQRVDSKIVKIGDWRNFKSPFRESRHHRSDHNVGVNMRTGRFHDFTTGETLDVWELADELNMQVRWNRAAIDVKVNLAAAPVVETDETPDPNRIAPEHLDAVARQDPAKADPNQQPVEPLFPADSTIRDFDGFPLGVDNALRVLLGKRGAHIHYRMWRVARDGALPRAFTVSEAAVALGMSDDQVRRHLSNSPLLFLAGQRNTGGRPAYTYAFHDYESMVTEFMRRLEALRYRGVFHEARCKGQKIAYEASAMPDAAKRDDSLPSAVREFRNTNARAHKHLAWKAQQKLARDKQRLLNINSLIDFDCESASAYEAAVFARLFKVGSVGFQWERREHSGIGDLQAAAKTANCGFRDIVDRDVIIEHREGQKLRPELAKEKFGKTALNLINERLIEAAYDGPKVSFVKVKECTAAHIVFEAAVPSRVVKLKATKAQEDNLNRLNRPNEKRVRGKSAVNVAPVTPAELPEVVRHSSLEWSDAERVIALAWNLHCLGIVEVRKREVYADGVQIQPTVDALMAYWRDRGAKAVAVVYEHQQTDPADIPF